MSANETKEFIDDDSLAKRIRRILEMNEQQSATLRALCRFVWNLTSHTMPCDAR